MSRTHADAEENAAPTPRDPRVEPTPLAGILATPRHELTDILRHPFTGGLPFGTAARTADQLVQLQQATAAFGSALSVDAIADVVVSRVVEALDAAAATFTVVEPDTGVGRVVRLVGYPDDAASTWLGRTLPPDLGVPVTDAAATGRPLLLASADDVRARYPTFAAEHEATGLAGVAALPCVAAGETLGVIGLSFRGLCPLVDGDRALGEMLAAQCAQALHRVRLLEAQQAARRDAEASARHIARIQRLTERVSTALTTADVMSVVGEDVAGAVAGASAAVYAARPTDGRLELASEFGEQRVCETDVVPPGAEVTEAALLAVEAVLAQRLIVRDTPAGGPTDRIVATCVALPLGAGANVVGAVVLELRPPRALTATEQDLLLAAGRIAAQGITRARLQSLREEERRRLAREMHDEFGQTLTGLKLDLAYLARQLAADGGAEFVPAVRDMGARVDAAVDALRRIAAQLRPGSLDDLGLAAALEWQAAEFERRTGVDCELDIAVEPDVPEPAATAVFRVFQEALTNVARHASARNVEATLSYERGVLALRVRDDGVGIQAGGGTRSDAMGLVGMRERAAALGGTLRVGTAAGGGTEVCLDIPYAPVDAASTTPTIATSAATPGASPAAGRLFDPEVPPARAAAAPDL